MINSHRIQSETGQDELVLVGLTSWGPPDCADNKEAGVYASVAAHLDWIEENIKHDRRAALSCSTAAFLSTILVTLLATCRLLSAF